jgi:hypothetical protein
VELACAISINAELPAALDAAISSSDARLQVDLAVFSPRSHGHLSPTLFSKLITLSIERAHQVIVPCLEVGNYSDSRVDHVAWDALHNGFTQYAQGILNNQPSASRSASGAAAASSSSAAPRASPRSSTSKFAAANSDALARMLSPWRAGVGVDTTDTYLNLLDLDMHISADVHAIGALFGADLRQLEAREAGSLEEFGNRIRAIGRAHRVVRQPMRMFVVRCPCSEPMNTASRRSSAAAAASAETKTETVGELRCKKLLHFAWRFGIDIPIYIRFISHVLGYIQA